MTENVADATRPGNRQTTRDTSFYSPTHRDTAIFNRRLFSNNTPLPPSPTGFEGCCQSSSRATRAQVPMAGAKEKAVHLRITCALPSVGESALHGGERLKRACTRAAETYSGQ